MPQHVEARQLVDVRVIVRTAMGVPYPQSKRVTLRGEGREYQLHPFQSSLGVYSFYDKLPPGQYTLTVDCSLGTFNSEVELVYPGRSVTLAIGSDQSNGKVGQNFFVSAPDLGLVAIVFDGFVPSQEQVKEVEDAIRRGGVAITSVDKGYRIWSNLRLYRLEQAGDQDRARIRAALATLGDPRIRLGTPLLKESGGAGDTDVWGVASGQFVVCLPDNATDAMEDLLELGKDRVLRPLRHAKSAWLIETDRDEFADMAKFLDGLKTQKKIRYWEANYMARVVTHELPVLLTSAVYEPNKDLLRQKVDKAWDLLRGVQRAPVWVATIDQGIDPQSPNVQTNLEFDYDFDLNRRLAKENLSGNHGMAVYGIISSSNAGGDGVFGIAPEARHVALRFSNRDAVTFSEILLWLAGLSEGEPPFVSNSVIPKGVLKRPVDIISLSFDLDAPISETLSDTLQMLVTEGRSKKGTVVVCCAGNFDRAVTWLAEDPRTITVSNTKVEGGNEVRQVSNFGLAVDLCAQGEHCMSLDIEGIFHFGGTSAAAPMVAATAALMLSANPELTYKQVGDILRSTAEQVDPTNNTWVDDPLAGSWEDYRRAQFTDGQKRKFSQYYGYGRLDVEAAVKLALELK